MTSVNLEKHLTYLKTQESLLSERALFMLKNILCFSLYLKILYTHRVKQIIELGKYLCLLV